MPKNRIGKKMSTRNTPPTLKNVVTSITSKRRDVENDDQHLVCPGTNPIQHCMYYCNWMCRKLQQDFTALFGDKKLWFTITKISIVGVHSSILVICESSWTDGSSKASDYKVCNLSPVSCNNNLLLFALNVYEAGAGTDSCLRGCELKSQ